MLRNTFYQIFKILRRQEQMILSFSMYEKTYLLSSLEGVLEVIKYLASSGIHTISEWLDLLFKVLHQERKRIHERISIKGAWAT